MCSGGGIVLQSLGMGWGGASLTLAAQVGAGDVVTLVPQAAVAPRVADPVVGGGGEDGEDVGKAAQEGATELQAPLHPHSGEASGSGHRHSSDGGKPNPKPTDSPPHPQTLPLGDVYPTSLPGSSVSLTPPPMVTLLLDHPPFLPRLLFWGIRILTPPPLLTSFLQGPVVPLGT